MRISVAVMIATFFLALQSPIFSQAQQLIQIKQIQGGQIFVEPGYPVPQGRTVKPAQPLEIPADTNPDPKSLQVAREDSQKAREFVRDLDSTNFNLREKATRELAKMGRIATQALQEASDSDLSSEARMRVDLLLPQAKYLDMEARVFCFLADKEGKFDHQLPGWKEFQEIGGGVKKEETRELYGEIIRSKNCHELLLAYQLKPAELGDVLTEFYKSMQGNNYGLEGGIGFRGRPYYGPAQFQLPEIATALFLEGSYPENQMRMNAQMGWSINNYIYNIPNIDQTLRGTGKYSNIIKKLVIRWMDSRQTQMGVQTAMSLAQSYMPDLHLKYCSKMLDADTDINGAYPKASAIVMIAQKNAKEFLPKIAKVFDDPGIVGGYAENNVYVQIPLGDFALAMALMMTDQKVSDYGLSTNPQGKSYKYNQSGYYFKEEKGSSANDKRKAAIAKWNEWAAKNLKDSKPAKPLKSDNKNLPKNGGVIFPPQVEDR